MNTLVDFYHDERLDQSETLRFRVPYGAPKTEFLIEDTEIQWRDRRFFISQIEKVRNGAEIYLEVEASALWYRLGEITKVGSFMKAFVRTGSDPTTAVPEPNTILGGLRSILGEDSDWGWDLTGSNVGKYVIEETDQTLLTLLRRWAAITGKHMSFDTLTKIVRFSDTTGVDSPAHFRYGRNLESMTRRSAAPEATVLYPFGRDDLSIAGINGGNAFVEDFSYYTNQGISLEVARQKYTKRRVWRDDTYLIDTNLKQAGDRQLAKMSRPTVAYECKVVDLAELIGTAEAQGLRVGDRCRVSDHPLGIDLMVAVVRLVRYPLEPWRNEIELSSLPEQPGNTSYSGRAGSSQSWNMFKHDNPGEYRLRNGGSSVVNRIGLNFSQDGEAVFGYDLFFKGVGTGSLSVSAFDAESNELLHRVLEVPYTNNQVIHENLTWAMKEMTGQYDVRVRMIATSNSGPSPSAGINIGTEQSRLWILAYGATQQTPVAPNTQRFEFNGTTLGESGTVQNFTVPDDVFEVEVEVAGSSGAIPFAISLGPGAGSRVTAKMAVTPGTSYDVFVGGRSNSNSTGGNQTGGWPNGGDAGVYVNPGGGGGGSSDIRLAGALFTSAIIVAGAGGGPGARSDVGISSKGGDAGFYQAEAGTDGAFGTGGGGASQWVPGLGGGGVGQDGDARGRGFGGNGLPSPGIGGGGVGSGGGGGGWYGGGGGGNQQAGGGGGSGWIDPSVDLYDLNTEAGVIMDANGYVEFRWNNPE